MDALQEKKFQKHVIAEFVGTLLFAFLGGAGTISLVSPPRVPAKLSTALFPTDQDF
jgi:hypothetical protein